MLLLSLRQGTVCVIFLAYPKKVSHWLSVGMCVRTYYYFVSNFFLLRDVLLYSSVLYCTVLYCTVLYCTVLYCTILYYTVLYYTVLYCTTLPLSTATRGHNIRPVIPLFSYYCVFADIHCGKQNTIYGWIQGES